MRIMFDTNAFDKMNSSHNDLEKIIASDKYEYYITSVQKDEIDAIPDAEKKQKMLNILTLCQNGAPSLPTPAIVDYARLDCCVVDEDDIYLDLLTEKQSNVKDAMIGSTAKRENCTVITEDIKFSKKLKKHSIPTMTYDEFIRSL